MKKMLAGAKENNKSKLVSVKIPEKVTKDGEECVQLKNGEWVKKSDKDAIDAQTQAAQDKADKAAKKDKTTKDAMMPGLGEVAGKDAGKVNADYSSVSFKA